MGLLSYWNQIDQPLLYLALLESLESAQDEVLVNSVKQSLTKGFYVSIKGEWSSQNTVALYFCDNKIATKTLQKIFLQQNLNWRFWRFSVSQSMSCLKLLIKSKDTICIGSHWKAAAMALCCPMIMDLKGHKVTKNMSKSQHSHQWRLTKHIKQMRDMIRELCPLWAPHHGAAQGLQR